MKTRIVIKALALSLISTVWSCHIISSELSRTNCLASGRRICFPGADIYIAIIFEIIGFSPSQPIRILIESFIFFVVFYLLLEFVISIKNKNN